MQRARIWAWFGSVSCLLACQTEAEPEPGNVTGTSGASMSTAGAMNASGSAGAPSAAGSAGKPGGGGTLSTAGTAGKSEEPASGAGGGAGESGEPALPKRVLLYHFSTLNIASISGQLTLLSSQLEAWGYEVQHSVSAADLSEPSLSGFAAVGMINTCFEPFGQNKMGDAETAALTEFVEAGGGLFGTHCAAVTFQALEPPHPYNALIGGRGGHGYFDGVSACSTAAPHPTTALLPATFEYTGNLDNADYLAPDTTVLVKCKWSGGEQKETAVSWFRSPGQGRVFYTNFAKEDVDLTSDTLGAKHILPGLAWVLGR